ncbi:hypothetical protein CRG98_030967 [Punica granatum]|uniref:Uncharacterized protein n=1 Tax=Punica granatum TaxID=22663 RepID=A0A2I0IX74_PUNGR|nr:hypothetical protein CRG98_030967 [Punica granatum]
MVIPSPEMRDGTVKVGLDRWWVGFGLFLLEQTPMEATDPTGALDKPDWHPGKKKLVRVVSTVFLADSLRFWVAKGLSGGRLVAVVLIAAVCLRVLRAFEELDISMEEEASCMEEEAEEEGWQRRVTAALGQAVGPAGLEGS